MYSLEVIKSINNRPAKKSAVQSRDCSVCFSRGGAVIHSARHRDTVFIYGSAEKIIARLKALSAYDKKLISPDMGEALAKFRQPLLNRYIETIYSRFSV
jgi:hypothetical protein